MIMSLNSQERLTQSAWYITTVLVFSLIVALLAVGQAPVRAEQTEIPEPEYDALVALYNSTDGENWANGWALPTDEPCALYGVTCQDGHVTELDLGSNQLTGSIPLQLGNLTNLSYLSLRENQLTGSIPPELGDLINLSYLSLRLNQLTDEIPSELGNLSNLQTLDLPYNQLSGEIPFELGDLSSLEKILFARNQLSGEVPPEPANLEKLEWLDIPHNQLTGSIPSELGELGNLTIFNLQDNQLSGTIPPEIGSLTNLELLSLWGNQLSGSIPSELGTLSNLYTVSLNRNRLSGTIPSELGNLTDLTDLSLAYNQLEGDIPESFVNLVNLRDPVDWEHLGLNLDYNYLNVPTNYPDPDNPLHVLLYSKDPNWHLRRRFYVVFVKAVGNVSHNDNPAIEGDLIQPGDFVTVGEDGLATIEGELGGKGIETSVGTNTNISITEESTVSDASLEFFKGKLRGIVDELPEDTSFEIWINPFATLAVRGTEWLIEGDENNMVVTVLDGSVEVWTPDETRETVIVEKNHELQITSEGLGEPYEIDPDEIDDWWSGESEWFIFLSLIMK